MILVIMTFLTNKMEEVTEAKPSDILFITSIQDYIRSQRDIYMYSAIYYRRRMTMLSTPMVIISAVASLLSALSTMVELSVYIYIVNSILLTINVILQSVSTNLKYETRYEMFTVASEQYDLLLIRSKFEQRYPNEDLFREKMELKLLKIRSNCKFHSPESVLLANRLTV